MISETRLQIVNKILYKENSSSSSCLNTYYTQLLQFLAVKYNHQNINIEKVMAAVGVKKYS